MTETSLEVLVERQEPHHLRGPRASAAGPAASGSASGSGAARYRNLWVKTNGRDDPPRLQAEPRRRRAGERHVAGRAARARRRPVRPRERIGPSWAGSPSGSPSSRGRGSSASRTRGSTAGAWRSSPASPTRATSGSGPTSRSTSSSALESRDGAQGLRRGQAGRVAARTGSG